MLLAGVQRRAKTGRPKSGGRRDRTRLVRKAPFRSARTSRRHFFEEYWPRPEQESEDHPNDSGCGRLHWPQQAPADGRRSTEAPESSLPLWDPLCGDDAPRQCANAACRLAALPLRRLDHEVDLASRIDSQKAKAQETTQLLHSCRFSRPRPRFEAPTARQTSSQTDVRSTA